MAARPCAQWRLAAGQLGRFSLVVTIVSCPKNPGCRSISPLPGIRKMRSRHPQPPQPTPNPALSPPWQVWGVEDPCTHGKPPLRLRADHRRATLLGLPFSLSPLHFLPPGPSLWLLPRNIETCFLHSQNSPPPSTHTLTPSTERNCSAWHPWPAASAASLLPRLLQWPLPPPTHAQMS